MKYFFHTEKNRAELDMKMCAKSSAALRLQGFIEYSQVWEKEIERIFNLYPEIEDDLLDAEYAGRAEARSEFSEMTDDKKKGKKHGA
jgi:hypothetical protein